MGSALHGYANIDSGERISNITKTDYIQRIISKPARGIYSLREKRKINNMPGTILYKNKELKFDETSSLYELYETFIEEQYKWLDVKGKTVIDIGAGTGDSAIYFMLNGAKRIFAFEPDENRYQALIKNVKDNQIDGIICIPKAVEKLSEVLAYVKNDKNLVLKCDVEGAEYKIFSSRKSLQRFSSIILEFHNGYLDLDYILKISGFKTQHWFSKRWSGDTLGMMVANINLKAITEKLHEAAEKSKEDGHSYVVYAVDPIKGKPTVWGDMSLKSLAELETNSKLFDEVAKETMQAWDNGEIRPYEDEMKSRRHITELYNLQKGTDAKLDRLAEETFKLAKEINIHKPVLESTTEANLASIERDKLAMEKDRRIIEALENLNPAKAKRLKDVIDEGQRRLG